jgi:hypothetical protein
MLIELIHGTIGFAESNRRVADGDNIAYRERAFDEPSCAQVGSSGRLRMGQPVSSAGSWIGSSNIILRISE